MSQFLKKLRVNLQQLLSYHPEKRFHAMRLSRSFRREAPAHASADACTGKPPNQSDDIGVHLDPSVHEGLAM